MKGTANPSGLNPIQQPAEKILWFFKEKIMGKKKKKKKKGISFNSC